MLLHVLKALFFDDLLEFLDFYFFHFPRNLVRDFFDQVYSFDKTLKFKANLRNLTKPLYGDNTFLGYVFAFPYRLLRISLALIFFFVLALFYLIFLFLWLILPFALLGYGFFLSK